MDPIYKFQPHRTMHLQGFDGYGAAAALWGASDAGFTVSGVFRDMADFAVLVLFQKDDPFGHPLFSYLPDGDLTGLVLDFDVTWQPRAGEDATGVSPTGPALGTSASPRAPHSQQPAFLPGRFAPCHLADLLTHYKRAPVSE
jgi:hypothetical protein